MGSYTAKSSASRHLSRDADMKPTSFILSVNSEDLAPSSGFSTLLPPSIWYLRDV